MVWEESSVFLTWVPLGEKWACNIGKGLPGTRARCEKFLVGDHSGKSLLTRTPAGLGRSASFTHIFCVLFVCCV